MARTAGEGGARGEGRRETLRKCVRHELHMTTVKDAKFARLICDEAQLIRNPASTYNRFVGMVPKKAVHMVSATPTLNRLDDIKGFVIQMWRNARLPWNDQHGHTSTTMLGPEIDPGDLLLPSAPQETRDGLRDVYERGFRWWLLNPQMHSLLRDGPTGDVASMQSVFTSTACFTIRRGMDTRLVLPDGTSVFPREGLMPHRVITEELSFGKRYKEVTDTLQGLLENLTTVDQEDTDDNHMPASDDAAHAEREVDAVLNMSVFRAMWLLSQDYNSFRMLEHDDDPLRGMSAAELQDAIAQAGRRLQTLNLASRKGIKKATEKDKAAGKVVSLGTDHVERLIADCDDGGLSWMYSVLSTDDNSIAPTGRCEMVHWITAESPMLTRCLEIALANKERGRRTLFMVNSPWMQQ